ncbi:hypothetical protein LPJ78_002267 [Coemansia sp. RSA 989]|nr:hypothetical protein LPJ68_001707 [Coemansia sp. RSA 1086]KAJ1751405.1 hypothetical protein LPJ79_002083 [Coemansia sp. RSA 1821]KAJ1865964.1 hypothetical protein LPJ78_002267 [Coemansia sp. RSA 989]KAJ1873154.1 hypothetical protein LPJ55_002512 [Coemansia sp. RSA 990]KAJ2632342.1 hypothetical protein H4R22_001337 [Coemansia sp. RSA 1290]KAJ2651840.1 hypothetical protein IWW40_001388 [Coemansia sp. RSA 1250]KAJ2674868.1 hypothetical protein IWW42_001370 [Coemansia sp. RSA 1085]
MDPKIDLYELLGISSEAGEKEITKAYRVKALQYHPDKNRDRPDAAQLFHDIKAAYDLLTDPKQRSDYDAKRRVSIAKRQRQNALSSQRKRMKSELERAELQARNMQNERKQRESQNVQNEAARFREEMFKAEWRHDKEMRKHMQEIHKMEHDEEDDELDRTIRIKWDDKLDYSQQSLTKVFSSFGQLEEVVVAPVSDSSRKRGKFLPTSALLVFKSVAAAQSLMNASNDPQLEWFEMYWANGAESNPVKPRFASHADSRLSSATDRQRRVHIPDISAIDPRQVSGGNLGFAEFEKLTLTRMRQHGCAKNNC